MGLSERWIDMPKILGVDLGSLTIKAATYAPSCAEAKELEVIPHERQPVQEALSLIKRFLGLREIVGLAITGDSGESLAKALNVYYINPYLASAEANIRFFPHLRTILNIGASSSYLIKLREDEEGNPGLDDIILPPHCSAGTGSFLDQSASRFGYSIREFGLLALRSKNPENISGTCAVFAGSDMIDKQQKGARREDIAAGLHNALIRYLLGTLSRGQKLEGPYSFQGGVAANAGMVKAFEDILSSSGSRVKLFIPEYHRSMSAIGAAILASQKMSENEFSLQKAHTKKCLKKAASIIHELSRPHDIRLPPLLTNEKIMIRKGRVDELPFSSDKIPVYVGVDVGSVSTGVAVLYFPKDAHERNWNLLGKKYLPTQSNPLGAVTRALREINTELGPKISVEEISVTGSGRKLIADYLGGVMDVNEITAHRTGAQSIAERTGVTVDEIIEIGGQDSKYIKGIEHFDMNKSCAAGTGSFIEEQAKQLGVKIQDFAPCALHAERPVSFGNKKCAVFIEEELAARQEHQSTDDLLASAAYAVAENYLNQFKIGDRSGKTIFFQGGVALNEAVVVALQHQTKANLIVPEHNEVMGAIGAAIHAKQHYSGRTNFIGLGKIEKRDYALDSFSCEGCANLCHVSQVSTNDGMILYGGDRCEKYSLSTGRKRKSKPAAPDLFKEREQLLSEDFGRPGKITQDSRPLVGIPRLFSQYYDYFPLWRTFFEALGLKVVTSGKTNQKIIARSQESVVAETCFPAEMAYGHLKELVDRDVDYIFFPCLIDSPQTRWKERKTHFCTLSQNMPFAATCTLPELSTMEDRVLRPAIHLHERKNNLEEEMIRVAKKIGKTKKEAKAALQAGLQVFSRFEKKLKERGRDVIFNLDKHRFPVVVVGRSYVLEDPGINCDLPRMMLKAGAFPVPLDYLPLDDVDISDVQTLANWSYYHRIMRGAEIVRTNARLNSIFFSVFSCGPDAFLEEFYREALGGKPYLGIEVGKTTAPAHIQTRVEAFMDNIRDRRNMQQAYRKTGFVTHIPRKRRILYVPRMDEDVPVFCEALKLIGIEARALDLSTPESLAAANRYIPEKTCLPVRMTAGDYLHFLMTTDEDPGDIAFFNNQADGACRQKVYSLLQEFVFRRLGFDTIPVITPVPGKTAGYIGKLELINGGQSLNKIDIVRFFVRFWQSITANESIRQLVLTRRPYEIQEGSVDEAYSAGLEEFCKVIVRGNIKKGALDFLDRITRVPVKKRRDRVTIGIVGEGYARTHGPSNHFAIRCLEELGAVTVLPMASSYLNYALENAGRNSGAWFLKCIKAIQECIEHKIVKPILPALVFPEASAGEVIDEAAEFTDPRLASEAVEGIGTASLYRRSGRIHGVLNLMPAHCMAGSALQCYLEKLHRDSGIPVLTISLDGIYDKAFKLNLEVLVHKAKIFSSQRVDSHAH